MSADIKAISDRFTQIYEAILATQGKNKAICASMAARYITIESTFSLILDRVETKHAKEFEDILHDMLIACFNELCDLMETNPEECIKLSRSFKEVTKDLITVSLR